MDPSVGFYRRFVAIGTTDYTTLLAELRAYAATITGATGSQWSETQYGAYDTTALFVILTHADGAQMFLHVANTILIHADNSYLGVSNTRPGRLQIAFKPSLSGGTFAAVTDSVNPADTSTYCADAGSFRFHVIYSNVSSYDQFWKDNVQLYTVIDKDSAYMWLTSGLRGSTTETMLIHADDAVGAPNFTSLNPGDTDKPFTLWDSSIFGGTLAGQFYDNGGTFREGGIVLTARTSGMTWATDGGQELMNVFRYEMTHATYGRKGLIDERVFCCIRSDSYGRHLLEKSGEDYRFLCWDQGPVFPWPTDEPVLW